MTKGRSVIRSLISLALAAAPLALAVALPAPAAAQSIPDDPAYFQLMDVFALEYASDPQVSPDGRTIAYVRRSFDVRADRVRSNIWTVDVASGAHRPLLSGSEDYSSPRWSPDGERLAYVTGEDEGTQVYVHWVESGETARVTNLTEAPSSLAWSPDGAEIAFTMFKKEEAEPLAELPSPPEGAEWGEKPVVIDQVNYRFDGQGYAEQGLTHLFLVPAEGGTPRQLTRDDYDYGGTASWGPQGSTLYVSADRTEAWREGQGQNDLFAVDARTGSVSRLTDTAESEFAPMVSPDGRRLAYLKQSARKSWHQPRELWVSDLDGSNARRLAPNLDRTIGGAEWAADGRGVYFLYDDGGTTKLALASLNGDFDVMAEGLGGESIGRPYSGASLSVADDAKTVAFTLASTDAPAELAVLRGGEVRQMTQLNADLKAMTRFGEVEELWASTPDGTRVQSWLVKPPNFDPARRYPLILEIHGGPHANYGERFSAEAQLYAAAGYVVLYSNPRGSTGYGDAFATAIQGAYPGPDYDDLMAAVDAAVATGYVDPEQLFVTGGSGGGVLTAWIVGRTDRFRAAVVAKPVINWTSFALTADIGPTNWDEIFGTKPWEDQASYWARSPLSLVGNVETPTMVLTGEDDYRTPMSETEQYYAALKIEGVDTAMVRIRGAGHSIAARPSNLIAKVGYILAWFDKYRPDGGPAEIAAQAAAEETAAEALK